MLGPAWCFAINGASFIAVIVALALMDIKPQPRRVRPASALADLAEGLRYVRSHSAIRTLILTAAATSLFGMGYATLLPAWAVEVLHGGPDTNGFLQSARGAGSLLGALMIASMGHFHFKGKVLTLGSFVFPVLLLIFAVVSWLPLALLVLVGVGWGFMIMLNMANALVQTLVSDELRGRVMAVYSLGFLGMMPIGALVAGGVAQIASEPIAVIGGALVTLGLAVWLWARAPQVRALE